MCTFCIHHSHYIHGWIKKLTLYLLISFSCFIGHIAVFFGAFLGPIFAIILFNCVVFVIITTVIVRQKLGSLKRRNETMTFRTTIRLLVNIVGVMFLFGLTWLFGAFTITETALLFQIMFAIFNSLQGIFIFLVFCAMNKDAHELWRKTITCLCVCFKGDSAYMFHKTSRSTTTHRNKLSSKNLSTGASTIPANDAVIASLDTSLVYQKPVTLQSDEDCTSTDSVTNQSSNVSSQLGNYRYSHGTTLYEIKSEEQTIL